MYSKANDLPILMYHAISSGVGKTLPRTASIEHSVRAEDLSDQLDEIVDGHYRTLKLEDLDRPFSKSKSIMITFDDGHQSDATIAAPLLAHRNLHAIFFVVWSYLGTPGYLSFDQVLALRAQGFEIGSHGLTHARLTQISPAEASNEVLESKARLETLLQEPVISLALPGGHYNDFVLQTAWGAGYRRVMTSDFRIANRENPLMPRMGPMAYTSLKDFKWMLGASRAGAIRHRTIEAIGERLDRLAKYKDALLTRVEGAEPVAKSGK